MTQQTQAEANVYWADKDYKKWVVTFTAGTKRKPRSYSVNVGASSATLARSTGLAAADLMGHRWCRTALAKVRLATAFDLGCVATSSENIGSAAWTK